MPIKKSHFKIAFIVILTYVFITGALFFAFNYPSAEHYLNETNSSRFWYEGYSGDQVALVEDWEDALKVRLDWINQAQTSIDLAYHSLHKGIIADVFFASLLEAADRGVQVRIIMDGIFHGLYFSKHNIRYVLQFHPNIEYRLYEPLNIFRPWTWNNRLHDKLMIVDNQVALISGRNVGNRYYMPAEVGKNTVIDRDVIIYNLDLELNNKSGLAQMTDYFNLLWEHPFTKIQTSIETSSKTKRAAAKREQLLAQLYKVRDEYPDYFIDTSQWIKDQSIPVNQVTLLYNPIQRGKKEPWIWAELVRLMEQAKSSIIIQSPYIIPTNAMLTYINQNTLASKEVTLVTNSLAASPNPLAIAGYKGKRNQFEHWVTQIWEYSGPGSLHGKALIIDDDLSIVGSFNIDARSTFLSTETMLVIHSKEFNQQLRNAVTEKMFSNTIEYKPQTLTWYKAISIFLLQIVANFFDYLL